MKQMKKKKNILLLLSIILSIGFIAGIPLLVIGANGMEFNEGKKIMMIFGIIGVALGFYGSPIAWMKFGFYSRNIRICSNIVNDGVRDINILCRIYNIKPKEMRDIVNKFIQNRYILNLILDDKKETLTLNEGYLNLEKEKQIKNSASIKKCPFCGAQVSFSGVQGKCPYCGNIVNIKSKTDND